jgi:hypothetical protein
MQCGAEIAASTAVPEFAASMRTRIPYSLLCLRIATAEAVAGIIAFYAELPDEITELR